MRMHPYMHAQYPKTCQLGVEQFNKNSCKQQIVKTQAVCDFQRTNLDTL